MERKLRTMLYQFTNGSRPCESHLVHVASREVFELALQLGYIEKFGENSVGEQVFSITSPGRAFRDE